MKVIFFGLGSIGKRHLTNLQTLSAAREIELEIHAFRSNKKNTNRIEGITNIYEFNELADYYDVVFITNPTSLHYETILKMNDKTNCFFVEKPLFEKVYNYETAVPNQYYIAAPLRYKKTLQAAKTIISKNTVYHGRAMCSSYLPNWRNEDYRESYSAQEELGGGIELDCIHELDYVTYLFGLPENTKSMMGRISRLEINSNDSANYLLDYRNMFVEVHVDYFGRIPQRKLELITENDTYIFDLYQNTQTTLSTGEVIEFEEETNDMYMAELTYLLDYVMTGKSNHNNFNHALDVLKIAKGD